MKSNGATRSLLASGLLGVATLVTACAPYEEEVDDAIEASFESDGKADDPVAGSRDTVGVLRVANESSYDVLRTGVGLSGITTKYLLKHRLGPDQVRGTTDDNPFDTLLELDGVPYVGPVSFKKLLTYARAHGFVPAAGGEGAKLGVNDVSILFPLPKDEAARKDFLWLSPNSGEVGPAFPTKIAEALPQIIADVGQVNSKAMVFALRYDPCFPAIGSANCQAQIRLVAQPVFSSGGKPDLTNDAALHLFYRLSATESLQVAKALAAMKALSTVPTDGPLGIHPALVADGMNSAFGVALRQLVIDHCRADNFIRVTLNSFGFDIWKFSKFDIVDGQPVLQPLVETVEPGEIQAWARGTFVNSLDDPAGTISPAPSNGFEYFLNLANYGAAQDPAKTKAAAAALLRMENPKLKNPETSDCVSCHLSTQARIFATGKGVSFDLPEQYQAPAGMNTSLVLDPGVRGNLGATISFGWHANVTTGLRTPSISQRVINESAEVADYINTQILAR